MAKPLHRILALGALALAGCDRPAERPEAPTVALSADALAFAMPDDGVSFLAPQSIAIRNAGSGTLAVPVPTVTFAAFPRPPGSPISWLGAAVVAEPGGYRLVVQPGVQSGDCFLQAGDYVATVVLDVPGAVNSPRTVQVTLKVPPPKLAPLPAAIRFEAPLDGSDPLAQVLELRGIGGYGKPLEPAVAGQGSWLTASLADAPGSYGTFRLSLKASAAGLPPGTYQAAIPVVLPGWGPDPGQGPKATELTVELWVPPAHLKAEPAFLSLSRPPPDGAGPGQVLVSNDGRLSSAVPFLAAPAPSWLSVSLDPTPPHLLRVTPNLAGLSAGSYATELEVRMEGSGNVLLIPVGFDLVPGPPSLEFPGLVFVADALRRPALFTVRVTDPNPFSVPAPVASVASGGWLSATVTGAAPPYTLVVRASPAGLAPGLHETSVSLASPQYPASEARLQVSLQILSWPGTAPMKLARFGHAAAALADGRALVVGGVTSSGFSVVPTGRSELYDPADDTWTEAGPLALSRSSPTATTLLDGRVLVAGGMDVDSAVSFEVFDPQARAFTSSGALRASRIEHTATLLADGKVLLAGGGSAELFDPGGGTSATTGSPGTARSLAAAVRLPSGKVLVAGGILVSASGVTASAELYDPATGLWSATGSMGVERFRHGLVLLGDGRALAVGGFGLAGDLSSAEAYDELTGRWSPVASAKGFHGGPAFLLPGGKVLTPPWPAQEAEVYDPATDTWTSAGGPLPRLEATLTVLSGGKALWAGGRGGSGDIPGTASLHEAIP